MYVYYFAIADMAQMDDGTLCEAYCKVNFPFPADNEKVIAFISEKTGIAKERFRPVTVQEYYENTDEEDEDEY